MATDPIAAALVRQEANRIAISAGNAISRATASVMGTELPTIIRALGAALDRRMLPDATLLATNLEIAKAAQQAVRGSFASRLPRGGTSQSGDLRGKLLPALSSTAMTAGTNARVISFIDPEALDTSARHWYRINYGAMGPAYNKPGGHKPEQYTVKFNARPLITLADRHQPARYSYLPTRWFWEGGDNPGRFVASRGPSIRFGASGLRTKNGRRVGGARPARFIDVGLRVVAEQFPRRYDEMFRLWVEQTGNRARLQSKGINVVVDLRAESYSFTVSGTAG